VDIDDFEFAFDCQSSDEIQRHSFGRGGFDDEEEFDTNVSCAKCLPPGYDEEQARKAQHTHREIAVKNLSSHAAHKNHIHHEVKTLSSSAAVHGSHTHHQKAVKNHSHPKAVAKRHNHHEVAVSGVKLSSVGQAERKAEASKKAETKRKSNEDPSTPPANVTKFGPGNCVATWRDEKTGHCIMQTDCAGQNTVNYNFQLICKEEVNTSEVHAVNETHASLVRHSFGDNSFEAKETFDTLIECDECLSPDTVPMDANEEKTLPELVKELKVAVGDVKEGMKNVKEDVKTLNTKVLGEEGKGEAEETKAEEGKAEEAEEEEGKAEEAKEEEGKAEEAKEEEGKAEEAKSLVAFKKNRKSKTKKRKHHHAAKVKTGRVQAAKADAEATEEDVSEESKDEDAADDKSDATVHHKAKQLRGHKSHQAKKTHADDVEDSSSEASPPSSALVAETTAVVTSESHPDDYEEPNDTPSSVYVLQAELAR